MLRVLFVYARCLSTFGIQIANLHTDKAIQLNRVGAIICQLMAKGKETG